MNSSESILDRFVLHLIAAEAWIRTTVPGQTWLAFSNSLGISSHREISLLISAAAGNRHSTRKRIEQERKLQLQSLEPSRGAACCAPTKETRGIGGRWRACVFALAFLSRLAESLLSCERGDRGGLFSIGWVDDEGAGEIGIQFSDAQGCRFVAELGEHFVGRALQRFAGDNGTDGENFFFLGAQLIADWGTVRIGRC